MLLVVLSVPWAARADEADEQYAIAAGHYAQQRWKLAAEYFDSFLSKYPDHPKVNEGLFYLGESFLQLNKSQEALPRFQQCLKQAPTGPLARASLFRAGETAFLLGNLDQGRADLERFVKKYPEDKLLAAVLPHLGNIALAQQDPVRAERLFREGLERFPAGKRQDDCRFGLADALEKQGKLDEAEKLFLGVAGRTSSSLSDEAQYRLGAVQYAMGKYADAIDSFVPFETRLAQSARQSAARLGRGLAMFKLDRPADAAAMFEKVVTDPKLGIEARYWLGLAQKAQQDWVAAAKTLRAAAEVDPKHPLAPAIHFHAGDVLLHLGDTAAAGGQFDEALASAGTDGKWVEQILRGKAQLALKTKDHKTLDRQAAEFKTRYPKSKLQNDIDRFLARSLVQRRQFRQAADLLTPLVASASVEQGLEDRYLLAIAQEGLKDYAVALATLDPVLRSAQGQLKIDAQLVRASLLVATKKFADAVAPLEAILAEPRDEEVEVKARGQLAVAYARTGRLPDAKKLDEVLYRKYPQHELILPMTEQLAEAAFEAGNTAWAKELFDRVARLGGSAPQRIKGLSGRGWTQFKANQLAEADESFREVVEKSDDPALVAEAALVRGRISEKLDRLDTALAMYDLVVERYAQRDEAPQALFAAARLRQQLHQNQRAAEQFSQLLQRYPRFQDRDAALYQWAWALTDLGKKDESSKVFTRLRAEYPRSTYCADATFRLAQRALEAKDIARAEDLVGLLLAGKLDDALLENTLFLRGQVLAVKQRWEESAKAFQEVVDRYPNGPLCLMADYRVAEAVFRQGDYATAAKRLERLVLETQSRKEPWLAVLHLRLAQAQCHQRKWKEAYAIASRIEGRFPGFEEQYEVDYVLGRCLAARAEFEEARETYLRVIRSRGGAKTQTAAGAQLMIGETYFHQKNYDAALREYLIVEMRYAFPEEQAAALVQAAICQQKLGDRKESTRLAERVLSVYPNTAAAKRVARPSSPGQATMIPDDTLP